MKKLLISSMLFSLLIPFIGTAAVPSNSAITDPEMNSELNDPAIDGHSSEDMWQDDHIGAERMEENDESQMIDYKDRTRTERERKALNTSSNASDDK